MSEKEPLIYHTILDVMGKIGAVGKHRTNELQKFQYRGIDDVMNELHGIMAECGLFVVPSVLNESRDEKPTKSGGLFFYTRMTIRFTFYAKDGSHIESVVIGEAMDGGDKASNKALAIGLKYALLQVFCIPTEDEKDPDGQSHEPTAGNAPKNNGAKQTAPVTPPKPQPKNGAKKLTAAQSGEMKKMFAGDIFSDEEKDYYRKDCAKFLAEGGDPAAFVKRVSDIYEQRLNKRSKEWSEKKRGEAAQAETPQEIY